MLPEYLLLSCQQSLAVNPVWLAQGDQSSFSSLCGTGLPAALNTPGPCTLTVGPVWNKEAHPFFSRCNFMDFNSLKHLLGTLCPCAVVPGLLVCSVLRYWSFLAHPMVSELVSFSWKPLPGWGFTAFSVPVSDSVYLCVLSSLCWERGRYMFLYLQGPLHWCCISALNIKVAEMVYVAKQ